MHNELKVIRDENKTTLIFDGGLEMLEFVREFVIPKAIKIQKDIGGITNFEYRMEGAVVPK
jgi:hypothetical protein